MPRVLVVDDDAQVRTMLQMTLEKAGYETEVAADGNAAIRLQRERPSDILITDIMMPDKDGLETIMAFRREFPNSGIIAISGGGCGAPGDLLPVAVHLGATRAFFKPVGRHELLEAVQALLNER